MQSMLNPKYRIMMDEIKSFLSQETYSTQQLLKLKDDIRGLFLYGDITDEECTNLLMLLPTLNEYIEDPVPSAPVDDDSPESEFLEYTLTSSSRFYNTDKESIEEKQDLSGFDTLLNSQPSRYYNSNSTDNVEDDELSPNLQPASFD